MSKQSGRFQILSLDGGGIKGIFSVALLAKLEEDLKIRIVDHFDLIAGTSTGGIIAIGLGLGLSPAEILKFYVDNGEYIFNWPSLRKALHLPMRKYSRKNLEACLRESYCFANRKFGDSKKRLIIPSYSLTQNDIYLFRTAHAEHLHRDYKEEAVCVALATSAAPTYFSAFKLGNNRLVDGGVWANNPAMIALTEAIGFLGADLKEVRMLSLGTTEEIKPFSSYLDWGGLVAWASKAPGLIMNGQSISASNQAEILLSEDRYLRINAKVAPNEFSLDKAKMAPALSGKAEHISRPYLETIKKMFLDHTAQEFVPLKKLEQTNE